MAIPWREVVVLGEALAAKKGGRCDGSRCSGWLLAMASLSSKKGMHTGEHCLQAANSSMALNAAVACGARRGARREEVRRNGEEGKGKGVGLLFAPSQRIRRAAHTWVAIPGPVGRSLARPACSVWRG
jgi:hypothetical protein